MKPIVITNGRIMDPGQGVDEISQVSIFDGKIQHLGKKVPVERGCEVIDATGLVVCPGFIDLHCHLRQPGYEYKETIASGAMAAAKGGFTTICCMPNTLPPQDNAAIISYVNMLSTGCAARVLPIGCITRGRHGEELADLAQQFAAGAIGFSDDGSYVPSARVMRRAMEYSRPLGRPIIEHCEEPALADGGQMNEGIIATRLGLAGIPGAAEEIAVARDIILAELTGAWLHIAHVSTAGSVELIRHAKRRGLKITAEVTPHHLTMTEERVLGFNTMAKVNPPLRTQKDINALVSGLKDGTLDIIATDHAPHADNDKLCEFASAASGISGFETAFGSVMSLVHSGKMDLKTLIARLTSEPAKILQGKINQLGTLAKDSPADVVIIDPNAEWTVNTASFLSKGKNTPLHGEHLKGKILLTVYGGEVSFRDEGF